MEFDLNNKNLVLFLLAQFPFASNDELETMLTDYLVENFDFPTHEWIEGLTGTEEETDNWNGYTFVHRINDEVTLFVEFHPQETIYFFNDTYLGNTGGNYRLSLLSWDELQAILQHQHNDYLLLLLLLLPLTIGRSQERTAIEANVRRLLKATALELDEVNVELFTQFIVRHLIFEEEDMNTLQYQENIGFVTNRNHSERSLSNNPVEITAVNKVITQALKLSGM
ncbi:immunity protein 19 of polymorphic toxin system [Chitinophaga skermanii]|uniref:Immunity protein 19 of polymorphic toxin system n=1 Tax=Chitinophaga skermanii TaxID=331697 RepID=A0A327QY41_9BACT|nr:Imm19 family immunity protein [Chitinophaga skermanii]RAJ08644.1 immunity protein 19 of polymorphic toxin system [Chitinophaga skermanii]